MKNTIKILSTLFVAAFFAANVNAQTAVTVNATVVDALVVANPTPVNFGQILVGATAVIDADAATADANLGAAFTAGIVTISGSNSTSVLITYSATALENTAQTMTYTPDVSFFSGSSVDRTDGTNIGTSSSQSLDGSGDGTIFVGGTMATTGTNGAAAAGASFDTDFSVTVVYN